MKSLFKILARIFAVLFLIAAYLQWNDPDATTWYIVYGIAVLASLLFYLGRLNYLVALILSVIYIIGTIVLWPEKWEGITIGGGELLNVERAREALGLLITGLVMLIYAVRVRITG